jgi:hypothetical protein
VLPLVPKIEIEKCNCGPVRTGHGDLFDHCRAVGIVSGILI